MNRKKRNASRDRSKLDELHAMAEEIINNSASVNLRDVAARALSGGYDFADTLHNIYLDFGYPAQLTFSNYWNMYRRFGIAANVVELPVDGCWSSEPKISSSAQLISELETLVKRLNFWRRVKGLDARQRVGRYAGMYMRVRDGLSPERAIDGTLSGQTALADMVPLYESQLEVIETDTDPMSETYGQPIILQYSSSEPGNRNEKANNTFNIHASRIVFAAEGADNGWIQGIPALEPVYNSLMDLRKIIGGGAEGFYKNAAQNIVFDLKDAASATSYADKLAEFNDQYDEFSRNRFRRAMWTPGMDAKTLDSTLTNPGEFFDIALNDVAAGSKIPATILIGKQTGRLASEEDSRQYSSTLQSRRENFCTEMTRNIIDWMIFYGVLPSADYEVEWDDLLARSDEQRLENAKSMAAINKELFLSGRSPAFASEEVREAAGYDAEPKEALPDETLEDEEDADS